MSISSVQVPTDNYQEVTFVSKRQVIQVVYSATGKPINFRYIFNKPKLNHKPIHITGHFKSNPATMAVAHFICQNGDLFPITHENYSNIGFHSKLYPESISSEKTAYYRPGSWDNEDEMLRILEEARKERRVEFLSKPKFLEAVYSVVKRLHIREETSKQTLLAPCQMIEEALRGFHKDKKEEKKQTPSPDRLHSPLLPFPTALIVQTNFS